MSVGISEPLNKELVKKSLSGGPLEQTLLELRREQLELKAQTNSNNERLDALHATLTTRAKHYGLTAEDFGASSSRALPEIKSVPKSDPLGKRIKSSIRNFAEKLFGFFKASNKVSDEEVFEPYMNAIDKALVEADRGETFADYFYNGQAYEMIVEPEQDDYKFLYKMAIDDLLEKSTNAKSKTKAKTKFMRRFAVLSSDFIYDEKDLNKKYKQKVANALYKGVSRYLDLALEDEVFTKEISKSKSSFRSAVPGIISATFKHAQEQAKSAKELRAKLTEYTEKIDNYFKGIVKTVYNQDDPDESMSALTEADYDVSEPTIVVLNQANDFLVEAQKFPSAEQDLRAFLKRRPDLMSKVVDDLVPLAFEMIANFKGLNIHGSSSILTKKTVEDSSKEAFSFEDKFIDVAELVYVLTTFKSISKAQSKRLTQWALSEAGDVIKEKMDLHIDTELFMKKPNNSQLKQKFLDNKQKIIFMYLMQSLNFDSKGDVVNVNPKRLTDLMNAVRKAQKLKK